MKNTIHKVIIEFISPLKISPFEAATAQITVKGNTARSANGSILLYGSITERNIVIGTISNATVILDGLPITTAASSPMYTSFPGNLLEIKSLAPSDIGVRPSIRSATIFGISTITAPIWIPRDRMSVTVYLPRIPKSTPKIIPKINGSPNIPIFSFSFSPSSFILFIPGILSSTLFRAYIIGAKLTVSPCGSDIPGSPK